MALSLPELQRRFARALDDPPAPGLALYARTIRTNYRRALSATFGVVKRVVGEAFFHAAADAYAARHPSTSGDLGDFGDRFGEFLATYEPARDLAYLADLARLEWALDEATRAASPMAPPADVLASLARVPGEALAAVRFVLAPSCRFVASADPVLRIWRVHQPDHEGEMTVDWDAGGERVLLRRDADGVALEALPPGEWAWLEALGRGESLGAALESATAAQEAFDVGAALRRRIADGTIAGLAAG